jgi:hypothetical protein
VPEDSVTATASTTTEPASIGRGFSAAKPSLIRGRPAPGSTRPRDRTPTRSAADAKNDAALSAKNQLIGRNASSRPAIAQPPTESESAVARTSPFACCTFRRSTSSGSRPP